MSIYHPDVVVRGELKLAEGRSDTIANPVVILEVLSKSTRDMIAVRNSQLIGA